MLSPRDCPLRSTASIDGVYDPEQDPRGAFSVYEPSPEAHRLRSLVENLPDMRREHVLYFTQAAMSKDGPLKGAFDRLTDASRKLATDTLIAANPGRRSFTGPFRLEARKYRIGETPKELFGCLLVDGRDRGVRERDGAYSEQVRGLVELYLQRCLADVNAR